MSINPEGFDERIEGALMRSQMPEHTKDGFRSYLIDHIPTGDFLRAVLENKLVDAYGRADYQNQNAMGYIADFVYNYVPTTARGEDGYKNWLSLRKPKTND